MDFKYDEESPYGQTIIQLICMVATLQEDDKTYKSADVHDILSEIAAEALRIRKQVDRSARAYDAVHHTA